MTMLYGVIMGMLSMSMLSLYLVISAEESTYKQAAKDSIKENIPARWRKALIDAEAERAKESIK